MSEEEDGYDGSAELIDGTTTIPVEVKLRGHFDPISGKYSWYGRVAATPKTDSPRKVPYGCSARRVSRTNSTIARSGVPRSPGKTML